MEIRDIEDVYELSPIQQGLLYELVRCPDDGVYVEHMTITLSGALDPGLFQRAWQAVVDRHPILRTSFHWPAGGTPVQVVRHAGSQVRQELELLDWREVPAQEWDGRYEAWLTADRMSRFDLERPPLMRTTLIRREADTWVFAWRFSHLVLDGWSFAIAIADFLAHYRGLYHGRAPETFPVRPYRDYVAWWRNRPPTDEAVAYWRNELADFEPGEPVGHGGAPVPPGEPTHGFVHVTLDGLGDRLRTVARERALTASTLVQGAWNIVIARYQGSDEAVCGGTVAHRPAGLPGAETILGPLIVTLPARASIRGSATAAEWLREFQQRQAAGREQTSLPLVDIQRQAGWDESPMQTNVSYENVPLPEIALDDVGLRLVDYVYDGRPHFALTLVILPGDRTPLRVIYDRRRFSHEAACLLLEHLRTLLTSIADDPDAPVSELSMATPRERRELERQAGGPVLKKTGRTVLDLFAAHADKSPQAVAVRCSDQQLTYRELDERSARLAGHLHGAGIGPGSRVALCLRRSVDMIAAILAVVRTGAAYLPLDPTHPAERLAWIIEDAGASLLVTEEPLLSRRPGLPDQPENAAGTPVLCLDRDADAIAAAEPLTAMAARPADVMYVLYTSGSTGRPKGVPIRHRDVALLIAAVRLRLEPSAADVWAMFHSYGFDVSVLEIWGALATGARLQVLEQDSVRSASVLHRVLAQEKVTVLNQTPSAFELLALADEQEPPTALALRSVIFAGERLDPSRLRGWIRRHGTAAPRLINAYGITETTVLSTWHEITEQDVLAGTGSPIGVPLAHQRLLVLDPDGRQLPFGCAGELHVAGNALSDGYLNRPELTKERFVPDPWSAGRTRMYRTGDRARRRPDGVLEFLGRLDDQVKIRGFRVEPGEPEAVLRELPGVRGAAVVAVPGADGELRLVAYVVAPADVVAGLDAALRRRLAPYLVPEVYVPVPALPLNPSGKLDRRALPAPSDTVHRERVYVAPRTETERALARLASEALGLTDVGDAESLGDSPEGGALGVQDPLFSRGMHSLTAMRLMVLIRREFGTDVPLAALHTGVTVASLATVVDDLKSRNRIRQGEGS